jgi:hypothetical protein
VFGGAFLYQFNYFWRNMVDYPAIKPTPTPTVQGQYLSGSYGNQVLSTYNPTSYPQGFIGPMPQYSQTVPQTFIGPVKGTTSTGGTVLGTGDTATNTGSTGQVPQNTTPTNTDPGQVVRSWEDQQKSQIESGYNDYFSQLNSQLNDLPGQAGIQQGMVNTSYNQGVSDVDAQAAIGQRDLDSSRTAVETNQTRNLGSLAESLRNQFLQGQVMLGQRGAGDSSAANMYSYALSKLGSKQRTSIMNQSAADMSAIGDREFKLNTMVTQEKSRLRGERDNKLGEIGMWLSQEQNKVRQWIAEGSLRKSQDIQAVSSQALNTALQLMAQAKAEYSNRRSMLDQWAMNNATTISQLKANLGQVASYQPSLPQAQALNGMPQTDAAGNMAVKYGGGYFSDDERKVLGI